VGLAPRAELGDHFVADPAQSFSVGAAPRSALMQRRCAHLIRAGQSVAVKVKEINGEKQK
jgi:hypothetical protein